MTVLYEDNHIIAVNKTSNEIVQGDKTGDTPLSELVKAYIKEKYNKPGEVFLGVTHRLDRPTSGVVLFARTSKALARLNDMFKSHTEIKKTYWAIVANVPAASEGRLENYLIRNEQQNKSYIARVDKDGNPLNKDAKKAVLSYKTIAQGERYTLLEMNVWTLLGLWLQSFVVGFSMWALTICIFIIIYGRMIEIYLVTSIAPIPMATMMGKEWGGMGQNYLRSLLALAFQGFLIIICIAIYAVLVQNMLIDDNISTAIWLCMGYTVLLCFTLFKTSSLAKSIFNSH